MWCGVVWCSGSSQSPKVIVNKVATKLSEVKLYAQSTLLAAQFDTSFGRQRDSILGCVRYLKEHEFIITS